MNTYSQALKELAEPRPVGDSIKAAIVRAARIAGLPYPRAFNVWYDRARRIDDFEARKIEQALQAKRDRELSNDIHELRARLLKVESRLAADAAESNRPRLGLSRQQDRRRSGDRRAANLGRPATR
jgi:hypothetical protein